jgi:hypothetical protein
MNERLVSSSHAVLPLYLRSDFIRRRRRQARRLGLAHASRLRLFLASRRRPRILVVVIGGFVVLCGSRRIRGAERYRRLDRVDCAFGRRAARRVRRATQQSWLGSLVVVSSRFARARVLGSSRIGLDLHVYRCVDSGAVPVSSSCSILGTARVRCALARDRPAAGHRRHLLRVRFPREVIFLRIFFYLYVCA